ncbi:MAG: pantetheine-phosphate adenylyltransferase [Planctomycetota bacterium]|nr:pantetheine-phosphate adenylyltransferase [Planctomycetota bacterium]
MPRLEKTQIITVAPSRRKCVYAGSFDPVTMGHMWMIREGAKLFDDLIVAAGINPSKRYTFGIEERLNFLRECTKGMANVKVSSFENQFLVHFAASIGAQYILRGIRSVRDYEFEAGMRHVNGDLSPKICTVFLIPPRGISEISSSFVKGLVGPAGWERVVKQYIPAQIYERFVGRFSGGGKSRPVGSAGGGPGGGGESLQDMADI